MCTRIIAATDYMYMGLDQIIRGKHGPQHGSTHLLAVLTLVGNIALLTQVANFCDTVVLDPWSRVLLVKLTGSQLIKKFPLFYGPRRFITAFTSGRHLSQSWASSIKSMPPQTNSRSILILSPCLSLRHQSGIFPTGFSPKPCKHLSSKNRCSFPPPPQKKQTHS